MPTNGPTADNFKVGNTEGKENKTSVKIDQLPTTLPAKITEIGNVKGDGNVCLTSIGNGKSQRPKAVWLIGGIILTAINSIAANIISTYIQENYCILTQTSRLAIVACTFTVTLMCVPLILL